MFDRDTIFDVGAHFGEDSEFYLKKGFKVVAVEANPILVDFLKEKFFEEIQHGKLIVVDKAVSYTEGTVNFYVNDAKTDWGTLDARFIDRNENRYGSPHRPILVETITPDELFHTFGIPFYLKVDIEGADLQVISALRQSRHKPKYVSLESEMFSFDRIVEEFDVLEELGYSSFKVVQQCFPHKLSDRSFHGLDVKYEFPIHSSGPFGEEISGPWLSRREALAEYKAIFMVYKLTQTKDIAERGQPVCQFMDEQGYSLDGWYDTHAKLASRRSGFTGWMRSIWSR